MRGRARSCVMRSRWPISNALHPTHQQHQQLGPAMGMNAQPLSLQNAAFKSVCQAARTSTEKHWAGKALIHDNCLPAQPSPKP
eukprot:1142509-Pelagomonas_calceolata.AAC.3